MRNGRADPFASSERVLVLTASERDTSLACSVLGRAGHETQSCAGVAELCARIEEGAGAALLTEETLTGEGARILSDKLAHQDPWSDFPLVVFSSEQGDNGRARRTLDQLRQIGNITLLDRPVEIRTMLSAVQSSVRLRRRQYEARQAIVQRDQFLAMLSHELRNPLGAIQFALQVLEEPELPARVRERQRAILDRQARHLGRLVDDLLDVSQVTTGKVSLQWEPVELNELLRRCLQSIEAPARTGRIQTRLESFAQHVTAEGDAHRLEQVFVNLLTNALKYTPNDGRIDVVLEHEEGFAIVRVRDTGVGLAREDLKRVFDLFAQAETTLDRARGGMGIGLTLVKRLVELHGGTVQAFSAGTNHGSEFVVRLPARAVAVSPPPPESTAKGPPRRIVLIEDNADVRESLELLLRAAGHQVESAADGPSGVERVAEHRPEVAIVDLGLPGMDGFEVARRLRALLGSSIYLMALSGYGQPEDRKKALAAGFDTHLTKPADVATVQKRLAEAATARA
jgi:signal transduction histidine kinase/ActR/RegA family two-component response regulator